MTHTITGVFATRREAEMAVERLVQEHGLDRARVHAHAGGEKNSSATVVSGADVIDAAEGDRSAEALWESGAMEISPGGGAAGA